MKRSPREVKLVPAPEWDDEKQEMVIASVPTGLDVSVDLITSIVWYHEPTRPSKGRIQAHEVLMDLAAAVRVALTEFERRGVELGYIEPTPTANLPR